MEILVSSFAKATAVLLLAFASSTNAMDRFVPPPAPQINDGAPVQVEREIFGNTSIIHVKRSTPAPFRQLTGDYLADVDCAGDNRFKADLRTWTSPRGSTDEELVFLTLPTGLEDRCTFSVVSRDNYPWTRVFKGTVSSIPAIKD
jgi:hypothetical protein